MGRSSKLKQHLARRDLLFGERHLELEIEVAAERRDPVKLPTHAGLVGQEFGQRRARANDQGDIVVLEMLVGGVDMIGQE
jgi:hypothetical protein